jgi:hypothetical protein
MPPRLDIALAIARTVTALRLDMSSIMAAGLVLVALPGLMIDMLRPEAGYSADAAILLITFRAVLAMLFMAQSSWAVLARLAGLRLSAAAALRQGLARAQPGLKVALLAGAGIVAGLILKLFAQHGTLAGFALETLLLTLGLWAVGALMPAIPVAVIEGLGPMAALRRAASLTAGNRDRTVLLGLIAGIAVVPALLLVRATGSLWLSALVDVYAAGLVTTLAAVVYASLTTDRSA